jgi:hypothetical protein
MLSRINRPQVWFWAAAICFVVSTSMFWNRSLTVDAPEETIEDMQATVLPVLDKSHVVNQPRMYPGSYSQRPRSTTPTGIRPVSAAVPSDSSDPGVVHATWRTDDLAQQRRVERVSVKSIEVDQPSPVWLTGAIEIVQPEAAGAQAAPPRPVPHPLQLVEQAAAHIEPAADQRAMQAHVTAEPSVVAPKPRAAARPTPTSPAAEPSPDEQPPHAAELPRIIPAARPNRK